MLALLGENGAGKTTLTVHPLRPLRSRQRQRGSPRAPAPRALPGPLLAEGRVGMVHQHFTLAGNMTVLENIMLGTEPL